MVPGPKKCLSCLRNHDSNVFQKRKRHFIRPPGLELRRQITANGLSSYQLFARNFAFLGGIWNFLQCLAFSRKSVSEFMKNIFLMLSIVRGLLKAVCFFEFLGGNLAMLLFNRFAQSAGPVEGSF